MTFDRFAGVRRIPLVLLAAILLYGALLRFDALTQGYGPVASPAWLKDVQERSGPALAALRPDRLAWARVPLYPHHDGPPTHYFSDPYTYLKYARQMTEFSAAHHREPVFPFATKMFLWWLDDQDVAVSFASATFSLLSIAATYLLGAIAFSRAVGLIAALGLTIEYDVISWSVGGWRDDAFMFAIVMCAYAMVRYLRQPSRRNAAFVGLCAGFACLVRLTSVSFLAPALLWLPLMTPKPWIERARLIGVALLVAGVVVAPYILNCWRVFGDPLYAINYHTQGQLAMENRISDRSPFSNRLLAPPMPEAEATGPAAETTARSVGSATSYFGAKMLNRPYLTLDTIAVGLTAYPFGNKWSGFDRWAPWLGRSLSWAALVGLLLFLGVPHGRLLLVVLASSLIPFATTWKLAADWRFTQYAYPFFLIAAGLALERAVSLAKFRAARRRDVLPTRRRAFFWLAATAAVLAVAWTIAEPLPARVVREALLENEDVSIVAGERDWAFFGKGWSPARREGNVTFRVARGPRSALALRLPRAGDYSVTLRLDPFPPPASPSPAGLPSVAVDLNGHPLTRFQLQWNAERVGAYDVTLPQKLVTPGVNRLELSVQNAAAVAASPSFKLWYVRIRPLTAEAMSDPAMALDAPAQDAVFEVGQTVPVTGWAIDRGSTSGPGITAVRAYAFPLTADGIGAGVAIGDATLGHARPDIARLFGRQFETAGFALAVSGLPAGRFRLGVYAASGVTGSFNQSKVADVTIAPKPSSPAMALDAPPPGTLSLPFVVAGWAVDRHAPEGTGVDAVRVVARPAGGGTPVALGHAAYGGARPDVGGVFGARFAASGYHLTVEQLSRPGEYDLVVEARSTLTGTFNQSKSARISVK